MGFGGFRLSKGNVAEFRHTRKRAAADSAHLQPGASAAPGVRWLPRPQAFILRGTHPKQPTSDMWEYREMESGGRSLRFTLREEGSRISYGDWLDGMAASAERRSLYHGLLGEAPWEAFFWEHPPVTADTLDRPYECMLIESTFLAGVSPDSNTFSRYFEPDRQVVTFPNLGRDATLVVPCPRGDEQVYPHLGSFVREADPGQADRLWEVAAREMRKAVGGEPRWLSTHGGGVYWLHLRIDSIPKYYHTAEYRKG